MLGDAWPPDKVIWDWEFLEIPTPELPESCIPQSLNRVLPLPPRTASDRQNLIPVSLRFFLCPSWPGCQDGWMVLSGNQAV